MGTNTPRLISESVYGAPVVEREFYFAAATAAGDWVMVDSAVATTVTPVGGAAKTTTATADLASVLGVTREAVAAGTTGKVTVYGPVVSAKADSSVNAFGLPLFTVATAGTVKTEVETAQNRVGFCLTAYSGGYAGVFVTCG